MEVSNMKPNKTKIFFTILGTILFILAAVTTVSSIALGSSLNFIHIINWILAIACFAYRPTDRQSNYRKAVTQAHTETKAQSEAGDREHGHEETPK